MNTKQLADIYRSAHNLMRNIDGLQPQEAFDELLKFLFYKQADEENTISVKSETLFRDFESQKEVTGHIKIGFQKYLIKYNSWFEKIWREKKFILSDTALYQIYLLLRDISFSELPLDIRSTALIEFLTPDIRKGLGIYLTPESVVRVIVDYLQPQLNDLVFDPACGSGTFLIETCKYLMAANNKTKKIKVYGIDKNPRMLLLAELNLGHFNNIKFLRTVDDSLYIDKKNSEFLDNKYSIIMTNPPFGVILNSNVYDLSLYESCKDEAGYVKKRQQSEIVFLEACMKYLKPGGTLGIVLPKSVINNSNFEYARKAINKIGYVTGIIKLPPETFSLFGTQTTTIVLFMKKYGHAKEFEENIDIHFADIKNVGYDSTGRHRENNQLEGLGQQIKNIDKDVETIDKTFTCYSNIKKGESLTQLGELISTNKSDKEGLPLEELVEYIGIGHTPARIKYSDSGTFLIKVGNLKGRGISWTPRDRNFIEEGSKRETNKNLMLQEFDIVLTASAHSPVYIAKKIDIIYKIPEWLGNNISFVGEVMLIRPNRKKIDPFLLLAYLRLENTINQFQDLVKGQTAHLHPKDVAKITIPKKYLLKNSPLNKIAEKIKEETLINDQLEHCIHEQNKLSAQIF